MGVPTPEVGHTAAVLRREDHEVHNDKLWHWKKKNRKMVYGFGRDAEI
jgi:hypothetical protein